jgi:hypothetical protein
MGGRHKLAPLSFRPSEANRAWLAAQEAAGLVRNAVINAALDRARTHDESSDVLGDLRDDGVA